MDDKKTFGTPFEKGRAKTGGRVKGSRNKLSAAFLTDLCEEWCEGGKDAIKIMRLERPAEFVKVVAALMPAQFEISDSRLKELTDAELDQLIALAGKYLAPSAGESEGGESPALN